jgi:hypothetical protein
MEEFLLRRLYIKMNLKSKSHLKGHIVQKKKRNMIQKAKRKEMQKVIQIHRLLMKKLNSMFINGDVLQPMDKYLYKIQQIKNMKK